MDYTYILRNLYILISNVLNDIKLSSVSRITFSIEILAKNMLTISKKNTSLKVQLLMNMKINHNKKY